jgi:hypothetical protein
MILQSDADLELAAVVAYEHHIMLDGGGYPTLHYCGAARSAAGSCTCATSTTR